MNIRLSAKLSHFVIQPVSRLQTAAVEISEGNLDFEIAQEGEGEVKELCKALEAMRIKLKEAVYLQQKLDDNRKFLMSSISHDLKTPVTSIIGHIHGIQEGIASSPEKISSYLCTALSKAVQINSMIDDLLLYSKLDLNQMPFNFEKVNLTAYFADYLDDMRAEFETEGISMKLLNEVDGSIIVLMDRERFNRVMQNILDNCRKYIKKEKGSISIIIRETTTSVIIEVKDNGIGIPKDELPNIFERFYRTDSSRKSSEGSGLGLAIAKQIIEGHDGRIWAKSVEGEGTSILISLKKL
jgi:signal transduction histidine kinase